MPGGAAAWDAALSSDEEAFSGANANEDAWDAMLSDDGSGGEGAEAGAGGEGEERGPPPGEAPSDEPDEEPPLDEEQPLDRRRPRSRKWLNQALASFSAHLRDAQGDKLKDVSPDSVQVGAIAMAAANALSLREGAQNDSDEAAGGQDDEEGDAGHAAGDVEMADVPEAPVGGPGLPVVALPPPPPNAPAEPESEDSLAQRYSRRTWHVARGVHELVSFVKEHAESLPVSEDKRKGIDHLLKKNCLLNSGGLEAQAAAAAVDRKLLAETSELLAATSFFMWLQGMRVSLMELARKAKERRGRAVALLKNLRTDETPMWMAIFDSLDPKPPKWQTNCGGGACTGGARTARPAYNRPTPPKHRRRTYDAQRTTELARAGPPRAQVYT